MIPRYLNSSTVSIFKLLTNIYPVQLTNMALVLPLLIVRELLVQKVCRRCNNPYNSYGDGAIKTRSSAYASINSYKEAMV
jgi:hypothetical protein